MAWKPTGRPMVRQQRDKWVVRVRWTRRYPGFVSGSLSQQRDITTGAPDFAPM
jgi:hypothetical protein